MIEPKPIGRDIRPNAATHGFGGFEHYHRQARPVQIISTSEARHTGPDYNDG